MTRELTERQRYWLDIAVVLLIGLAVTSLVGVVLAGGAAAQSNNSTVEPLYNNTTVSVIGNDTWMENRSEATIGNVSSYVVDIGPFAIGTGAGQSEGIEGSLLTGFLVFGAVMSVVGRSRPGIVAGGVIAAVTVATLVEVSLAPMWVLLILALSVGILLARAYLHVSR